MSAVIENELTELVTLPAYENALQVFTTEEALDRLYAEVEAKVTGIVYDVSTRKGREQCASDAYKVARSKQAVEKLGAKLSAEYKEIPKKIDASRRRIKERFDALQEQIRQPLNEWEAAEEARVQRHRDALSGIESLVTNCGETAEQIRNTLKFAEMIEVGPEWEEFETEAHRARAKAIETLTAALAAREKYEAEQAELARLREEAEARRIQDEKDRIAREAAEAATKAAEAKAQAEREAAAQREAQAKAAAEQAERDRLEAIERQKQAEARAEAEKLAAEQRAKDAAEAARQAEIQRQADEAARIEAEQKAREADRAHKAKTNNAAVAALVAGGLTQEAAKLAVTLIAQGKVPAVRINY